MITITDMSSEWGPQDFVVTSDDADNILIGDGQVVMRLPAHIARSIAGVLMGMTADRAEELDHKRGLDPPITST